MSTESTDPRSLLLWIDDVCDQFENDWKLGRAPSLRHILNGLKASPAERPRFFKELFLLELELRSDAGETIDEAIYTAEFPEFRDLIETSLREFRTKSFKESPPPQEFADFETNLRYKLIEPLAEGGLGRIYRVLETTIGRELAMKEIKRAVDNPNTRARFDREARLTGKLDHPGISPVFGIGSHRDGRPLYVMRLIRGESLRDVIRALHGDGEGPGAMTLGLRTLLGKFVSVCDIIAYAHSKNIVHRDLKPSNVMLGPYGEVLVVDWGLAKEVSAKNIGNYETSSDPEGTTSGTASFPGDSFQTVPGRAVGTPQFMSPEQALAKIDEIGPLSDIYSLGATLYDLLTGRPPFSESNQSDIVLRRVVIGDFLSPRKVRPGLPRALEAVCLKAMALKPEDRYPNAEALAEDLRRWLADEPVSARPEPLLEKTRRWVIKRKVAVSGIAGALLLALCLGVPLVVRNRIAKQEDLTRAQTIVSLILSANDESLTGLIDGLQGNRGVLTELATRYRDTRLDDDGKLKAALAIGPGQIEIRAYLEEGLFDAPLSLLPLISERLKTNHSATLLNRLRSTMANERESSARRFRASIALARLGETHAPGDEALWKASAPMVVNSLIESISLDPSIIGKLVRSFDPVQHDLFPALAEEYRDTPVPPSDPAKATRRTIVMAILDEFKQTTRELAELLKDTFVGPRLVKYLAQIKSLGPPAVQAIQEELERPIALDIEENPETAADTEATRRSRLAVALFGAGRRDLVWSYFGDKEHPGFREEFIRRLPRLSAEVRAAILERLPLEKEPAIRRGMIESLASFSAESVAEEIPRPTRVWLLEQYRNDPDPGVHGSIGWFLRNVLNESAAVNDIDTALKRSNPAPGFDWFIDQSGQTLSIIHPDDPVMLGSPDTELDRGATEALHKIRIGRTFAIAAEEVTLKSYRLHVKATPETSRPIPVIEVPAPLRNEEAPVVAVSWRDAAGYCNWLSKLNDIDPSEWCYTDLAGDRARPVPDFLSKTGYRLPTEAEWETACRAGTRTCRPFGQGWSRANEFGWFPQNADGRVRTTGQKRPNGFGLFDMLGNASEWTLSPFSEVNTGSDTEIPADGLDITPAALERLRVIRGGSILIPLHPRSAQRNDSLPTNRMTDLGFRVCRTIR